MTFLVKRNKPLNAAAELVRFLFDMISMALFHVSVKLWEVTKHFDTAERLCRRRLIAKPEDYLAHYYLARSLRHQQKYNDAVEVARRIVGLRHSRFFMDWVDFLYTLHAAGRYQEVIAQSELAFAKLSNTTQPLDRTLADVFRESLHRVVGSSYLAMSQYREALPHLEAVCARLPHLADDPAHEMLRTCKCALNDEGSTT